MVGQRGRLKLSGFHPDPLGFRKTKEMIGRHETGWDRVKNEENSCFFVAAEGFGNVFLRRYFVSGSEDFGDIFGGKINLAFTKRLLREVKKAKDGARRWDTRTTATTKLNDVGTDFDDVVTHTDVGPT